MFQQYIYIFFLLIKIICFRKKKMKKLKIQQNNLQNLEMNYGNRKRKKEEPAC